MKRQPSETIKLGICLAFSGGFMDAYSYLARGGVFANAQTGNILLFGVNLASGNFSKLLRYALPILAFVIGVLLSLIFKSAVKNKKFHWRQGVLILEVLLFIAVSFIPYNYNIIANSLISLACGMQAEAFRKVAGYPIATTMCIGNLRDGTENLFYYISQKEKRFKERAILSFAIIFTFILGAIFGDICIKYFDLYAILACVIILLIAIFMMILPQKEETQN